jgi:hypothetical protein
MVNSPDHYERLHQAAERLLAIPNETPKEKWGEIADTSKSSCDKKIANFFLLCCLVDYQNRSQGELSPWSRARKFFFGQLNEEQREELWKTIAAHTKTEWEDKFSEYKLHWRRSPHDRLWQIASNICFFYGGDATKIWGGGKLFDTLCRLYYLGAGEQISRMIVGALKDCGYFPEKSDVKADVRVCRVLGRLIGAELTPWEAINLAREMYPQDPWRLDWPLWNIGGSKCDPKSPRCGACELAQVCEYANDIHE